MSKSKEMASTETNMGSESIFAHEYLSYTHGF